MFGGESNAFTKIFSIIKCKLVMPSKISWWGDKKEVKFFSATWYFHFIKQKPNSLQIRLQQGQELHCTPFWHYTVWVIWWHQLRKQSQGYTHWKNCVKCLLGVKWPARAVLERPLLEPRQPSQFTDSHPPNTEHCQKPGFGPKHLGHSSKENI